METFADWNLQLALKFALASAVADISRLRGNTSSIMVRNAPSIMPRIGGRGTIP
jgi:hypothetical protein